MHWLKNKLYDFWRGNVRPSEIFWLCNVLFSIASMFKHYSIIYGIQQFSLFAMIYAFMLGIGKILEGNKE